MKDGGFLSGTEDDTWKVWMALEHFKYYQALKHNLLFSEMKKR